MKITIQGITWFQTEIKIECIFYASHYIFKMVALLQHFLKYCNNLFHFDFLDFILCRQRRRKMK